MNFGFQQLFLYIEVQKTVLYGCQEKSIALNFEVFIGPKILVNIILEKLYITFSARVYFASFHRIEHCLEYKHNVESYVSIINLLISKQLWGTTNNLRIIMINACEEEDDIGKVMET